ncbi:hypothetical protein [Flavobacterium sp. NKUCC04_CG]|uniref:hypothetical protein n=1 Tax=Flavobacterium sp. NKUCC04_CG TaxID=2842121 RepID=UPI001C5AC67F|nr:hypothetical protein [Flavobacterium sp. NKUCC04_CG]MBW3520492.1 hypothetical protein [Flavobacterium sp. NKUCC04_CG]
MTEEQKKFDLYLIVLRFLVFKITNNLNRIYLEIDLKKNKMLLTAFYFAPPSELELLDDIVTNSNAHIPNLFIVSQVKLMADYNQNEIYDFIVFAVYSDISEGSL